MKIPDDLRIFGDVTYRNKNCPSESAEQISFFSQLARKYPELAAVAIHPRNEGKRTITQVQKEKAEGMNTGASDIVIPVRGGFMCELKRQDHTLSTIRDEQLKYLVAAQEQGGFACVALGCVAAFEALEEWLATK